MKRDLAEKKTNEQKEMRQVRDGEELKKLFIYKSLRE